MLKSERESAVAGTLDGQRAATEAGESPQEAKHPSNGISTTQAHSNALLPNQKVANSAEPSISADVNQQPTPGNCGDNRHATSVPESVKTEGEAVVVPPPAQCASTRTSHAFTTDRDESTRDSTGIKHALAVALDTPSSQQLPPAAATSSAVAVTETSPGLVPVQIVAPGRPTPVVEIPLLARAPAANHKTTSSRLQVQAGQTKSKATALRRGKWTVEEEAYVARVIQDFNSGFLNAPAGTTLRSYLSEKLQCDPMRITKKFTGDSCIGKRVFHPAVRNPSNAAAIDKAQAELDSLERRWRRRLEMQQRESAKKAAASAAAAAAATGRSHGFITQNAMGASLCGPVGGQAGVGTGGQNTTSTNGLTQTASWLDRASNILKETGSQTGAPVPQKFSLTQEQAQALQSLPKKEIEMQMKEVERLIHEGPIIQQTTAGLPLVLQQPPDMSAPAPPVPTTIVASTSVTATSDGQQTPPEPADKRMRTGAEDAEALVGFLTAVRASAAAGTDSFSG